MRFHLPAAVSLCLMLLSMSLAAPPVPTPAQPTPNPAAASSDRFAAEAAARHAKRTACLKDAKAKKLLGANKDAYIKSCVDAH